jgi:hypothetical protein
MFFKLVNLEYEIWIIRNYFSVTPVILPKKYLVHPWNSASCGSMQVALSVLPVWVASHNHPQLRENITPVQYRLERMTIALGMCSTRYIQFNLLHNGCYLFFSPATSVKHEWKKRIAEMLVKWLG